MTNEDTWLANEHMKIRSTSSAIKGGKVKKKKTQWDTATCTKELKLKDKNQHWRYEELVKMQVTETVILAGSATQHQHLDTDPRSKLTIHNHQQLRLTKCPSTGEWITVGHVYREAAPHKEEKELQQHVAKYRSAKGLRVLQDSISLTFGKQNYGPENRPVLLGRRKKQVWARSGLLPGVNRERDRAEESLSEWRSSSAHREGLSCPYSQFGLWLAFPLSPWDIKLL